MKTRSFSKYTFACSDSGLQTIRAYNVQIRTLWQQSKSVDGFIFTANSC